METKSKKMIIRIAVTMGIPLMGLLGIFAFIDLEPDATDNSAKAHYEKHCGNCHGKQGEGLRGLYPPLAGSDYLAENQNNLPCLIRYGMSGPIVVNGKNYEMPMPGAPNIGPEEISDIINYINTSWGNDLPEVNPSSVEKRLKFCKEE